MLFIRSWRNSLQVLLVVAAIFSNSLVFGAQGPDPFGAVKPTGVAKRTSKKPGRKPIGPAPKTKGLMAEPAVTSLPTESKRYALVVGVDSYQDPQINGLQGASNDARLLSQTLIQHANLVPDQVVLLSSDQPESLRPTRANILQRLTFISRSIPKDGMLILAFSGHGIELGGQAFLLPSDAKVDTDVNLLNETCINVQRIKDLVRGFGIQQVLLVLDTCRNELTAGRSGSFEAMKSDFTKAFRFDVQNRDVQAFATLYATSVGERAYEYTEKKQGYFSLALAEALAGKAADSQGNITLAGLVAYVQTHVPKRVRLELGREQHPFAEIGGYKADQLVVSVSNPVPAQKTGGTGDPSTIATALVQPAPTVRSFGSETVLVNARGEVETPRKIVSSGFTVELPGMVTLELVSLPAGSYQMGASPAEIGEIQKELRNTGLPVEKAARIASLQGPQQTVAVKGFHLGRFEVTQAQWAAVASLPKVSRDLTVNPSNFSGDRLPVENVSWLDAVEFCARLSLATNRTFRLPTEIEWEFACRAGSQTGFAFGTEIDSKLVNFDPNRPALNQDPVSFRNSTIPVGSLKFANSFGLFDMHGSVWEWCADNWIENLSLLASQSNSREGQTGTSLRPVRGGSWNTFAVSCRSTARGGINMTEKNATIGFRVVCE